MKQFNPFIILSSTSGGDVVVVGGGSGEGGITLPATPMTYNDWLASDWKDDYLEDGEIDAYDFAIWWETCGFSKEKWVEFNPGLP